MDSPKSSGSIRPAMGDSPPVQDSPFSLFASSLSPIPLNPVKASSFVTFPSPEPVFASPQVHQPRKLHQLKRSEHQLFLCSSSKEPNPTTGSSHMKMTKMPLENKSQDQPCSSSSLSIDTFLVDQSETTSKNPTNSTDIQNSDLGKPQEIQILKIEDTDHAQNEIQEINSNLNGKNIVSPTVTPKPSGIGLHLNSLAGIFTPLTSGPQESKPVHSVQNFEENQNLVNNNNNDINSPLLGKMLDPFLTPNVGKISSLLLEDSSKPNEEINKQNSPKKKRKRSGDDGHKSCNCKRSKCLKLYCECFGNGLFCNETCACQDCSNKLEDEETVKETRKQIETRNPLAFAPKVVLRLTPPTEENKDATPPSTRHKRGCNCKKSRCLKKYCECFQSGVACFAGCRCENCLNTFGSKDGAGEMIEVEQHKKPLELDTGTGTSIGTDSSEKRSKFRTMELNNVPRIPPLTPSLQTSMSHMPSIVPLHFQSSPVSPASPTSTTNNNNNSYYPYEDPYNQISQKDETNLFSPPQFTTSSSSHPFPSTPLPQLEGRKREREGAALQESSDYSPDILEQFHMRMGVVKSTSPKKKRVELPHERPQNSPGLRSGRKFILKSVPSLPSLSPYSNHNADNHNAP